MKQLSMSMFANKAAYYKALSEELTKVNESQAAQIKVAITYIKDTKQACGMATEATEEHLACWDAVLNAPTITDGKIVVLA